MSQIDLDTEVTTIDGRTTTLREHEGRVLLIVNTASKCGFTPQYAGLEALWRQLGGEGVTVLGFPCDQFGHQEPGDEAAIASFCEVNYGVSFPMFAKVDVNGANQHPIYTWLKAQPGGAGDITWNFNKFLIGRDGKLIKRYDSAVTPDAAELTADLEAALAK